MNSRKTKTGLSLDNALLVYIFDPDPGLQDEITDAITKMASVSERILTPELREIADAQVEFYTDVWAKIRTAAGENVLGGSDETQTDWQ